MDLPKLKHLYFRGVNRIALIEQFWMLLEVESLRAYHKYYRRLSNLSIKADFCLALDKWLRSADVPFEQAFAKELRLDLESVQPIKAHLKKIMGKGALRRSFPTDHNVSYTRLIFDLDYTNTHCKPPRALDRTDPRPIEDQVFVLMKDEVREYLLDNFGVSVYEDWLSHFVYGESLRSLASVRGVSHEAIRLRVRKAQLSLNNFLGEK